MEAGDPCRGHHLLQLHDSGTGISHRMQGGCSQAWQHPHLGDSSGTWLVEKKADPFRNLHAGMSRVALVPPGEL